MSDRKESPSSLTDTERRERSRAYSRKWRATNLARARELARDYARKKRAADPEHGKASRAAYYKAGKFMAWLYKTTPERLTALHAAQKGACAICGSIEPENPTRAQKMHIDHNHETGEIRGFLCPACNKGLGYFRDVPERLEVAAKYLRNPPARRLGSL